MTKIYPFEAGHTLGCHETFLKKLTKRGAKVVNSPDKSNFVIVFCPIVSRFETDIDSALSSLPEPERQKTLIVVAMHPTFDEDYTLPSHRRQDNRAVALLVDCLFFETKGFFKCRRNKEAVEMVSKKLQLKGYSTSSLFGCGRGNNKKEKKGKNKVETDE